MEDDQPLLRPGAPTYGEERQTVRVGPLAHPPLREAVSVLAGVVEVDVVEVAGSRVRRVGHAQVGEAILSDSEESVQQHISLVRVIKLTVPPGNEYPAGDVVQALLGPPVGLQGTARAVI